MDEERKARRRALGIPIHENESDCTFVDGYCTCGKAEKPETRRIGYHRGKWSGVVSRSNLDYIEKNEDNR